MRKSLVKLGLGLIILLQFLSFQADAQWMKIDSLGGSPVPSAALEISDTARGFLPPRLTTSQMNAVGSPATGLMIYNTDSSCYCSYNGTSWVTVGAGGSSSSGSSFEVAYIRDEKTSGTEGGGFTAGSWTTRDLNTLDGDTSFVSLSSNQFTLSAGTYIIEVSAPAFQAGGHRARLTNVANASDVYYGQNAVSNNATSPARADLTYSIIQTTLNISSSTTYKVEHRCVSSKTTNGLGNALSLGVNETYTQVRIIKLGASSTSSSSISSVDESGVLTLKDVKTNGTAGGGFTSGAWQTRDLNTKTGDTSFVVLSANSFVLESGVYMAEWSAPAYNVNAHKTRLLNSTSGSAIQLGSSEYSNSGSNAQTFSTGSVIFKSNGTDAFALQHRCGTSRATNGYGVLSNFGVEEVYAQIKLTKLDKVFGSGTSSSSSNSTDTLDENVFGARIANNGSTASITSQNVSWISSVSRVSKGLVDVTFESSFFGVIPFISGSVEKTGSAPRILTISNISATGCRVLIHNENDNANEEDDNFSLSAIRQGTDYKYNTAGGSASSSSSSSSFASDTSKVLSDADKDTYIATENAVGADNDNLRFITSGSERMRLQANGYLGLGTTSPKSPLHIGNNTGNVALIIEEDAEIGILPSNDFEIVAINTSGGITKRLLHMTPTGLVGLGTVSPDSLLTIGGGIKTTYFSMTDGAGANKVLTSDANGVATWQTPTSSPWTVSGSDVYRSSGNVGIGTTAPSEKFHIHGNQSNLMFTGGAPHSIMSHGSMIIDIDVNNNGTSDEFKIRRDSSTTLMTVTNDGNVGIGTSAPQTKLEISDSGWPAIQLTTTGSGPIFSTVSYKSGVYGNSSTRSNAVWQMGFSQGSSSSLVTDRWYVGRSGISSQDLVVNREGNVGIGTFTVDSTLTVAGGIKTTYFSMTDGAGASKVLTSDANGVATWQTPASGADNLGNHTATSNIQLNSKFLSNDGGSEGLSIDNGGYATFTPSTTGAGQNAINVNGDIITSGIGTGIKFTSGNIKILGNLSNSGDMQLYTSGFSRMRILSSGEVGIGTTSPTALLTLAGTGTPTARINTYGSSLTDASILYLTKARGSESSPTALVNGDNIARINAVGYDGTAYQSAARIRMAVDGTPGTNDMPGRIEFYTTADGSGTTSERMRITNTGSIGIGTSSSTADFEVTDSSGAVTVKLSNASNTDADVRMTFSEDGTNRYHFGYDDGLDALVWSGSGWTGNRRMALSSVGYLGIGINSPVSPLHVDGITTIDQTPTSTTGFKVRRNDDQSNIFRVSTGTGKNGNLTLHDAAGTVQVKIASGTDNTYFNGTGNFGIGTKTPGEDLVVTDSSANAVLYIHAASSTADAFMGYVSNGSTKYYTGYDQSDNAFKINTSGIAGSDFVMTSSANVGIGTNVPTSKLQVNAAPPANANSGQFLISESTTSNTMVMGRNQGYGYVQTQNSEPFSLNPLGNNVGIGITNPSARFHVSGGNILLDNTYSLKGENSSGTAYNLIKANSSNNVIIGSTSLSDIRFSAGTGGGNAMTIEDGGKVGIGTTAPSDQLEVVGGIDADSINVTEANSPSTGTANLLPLAYGRVGSGGGNTGGTGNYTISKPSTGKYVITVTGVSLTTGTTAVMVLTESDNTARRSTYEITSGKLEVYQWTQGSNSLTDNAFSFIIYKQ